MSAVVAVCTRCLKASVVFCLAGYYQLPICEACVRADPALRERFAAFFEDEEPS